MVNKLQRDMAEVSRSTEFFNVSDLQKQTGQPQDNFASVVVKELLDNAADHCETIRDDPEIALSLAKVHDECIQITVTDNGSGILPRTLDKILKDFDVLVSDKVNYRSPSRGQQGNALKTIIGMPYALGLTDPVIIETRGVRHSIYAKLGVVGVEVSHTKENIGPTVGTKITVTLPGFTADHLEPEFWVKSYALFNPNILVGYQGSPGDPSRIKHSKKFTATDLTAPAWYDPDTFKHQIAAKVKNNAGSLLRDFVMTFHGLSRNAQAKVVCDQFPGVKCLTDLDVEKTLPHLLQVMKETAKAPSPKILGTIGREHFKETFNNQFGGITKDRFYYKHNECIFNGIPYVIEAATAEVRSISGQVLHGLNYSPTFSDPLAGTMLHVFRNGKTIVIPYGLNGMVQACYADPHHISPANKQNVVTALHIVSPGLGSYFIDRGKTNLRLPKDVAAVVTDTLWAVLKTFYEQGKRIERDAVKEQRRIEKEEARLEREERGETDAMNEAVDTVLWDAYIETTQNETLPVSARDLYYVVRRWIQGYTSEELNYSYFTKLLVKWQQDHETKLTKLYYDPRGYLIEPDGTTIQLGTREVEEYEFPAWKYNKIMFVEKKGWIESLLTANIHKRFDIAIVASEGYATEAIRTLFQNADSDTEYKLFIVHDCDPHGYEIARTMQEETARMPGYHINAIDLGLNLAQALAMNPPLQEENFIRKKKLSQALIPKLTADELRLFTGSAIESGDQGKLWYIAHRIELNALTPLNRITWVEAKLQEHGATEKVCPPDEILNEHATSSFTEHARDLARDRICKQLDIEGMVDDALESIGVPDLTDAIRETRDELTENPPENWSVVLDHKVTARVTEAVNNWAGPEDEDDD